MTIYLIKTTLWCVINHLLSVCMIIMLHRKAEGEMILFICMPVCLHIVMSFFGFFGAFRCGVATVTLTVKSDAHVTWPGQLELFKSARKIKKSRPHRHMRFLPLKGGVCWVV